MAGVELMMINKGAAARAMPGADKFCPYTSLHQQFCQSAIARLIREVFNGKTRELKMVCEVGLYLLECGRSRVFTAIV
jgi:hypothetical protein